MRLGVLGAVLVQVNGRVLEVGSGRERFVLAMLLLNADQVVSAERLIDALWQQPPRSAKGQLHNMIRNLRTRLSAASEELILTRPLGYELKRGEHEFDLHEFRQLVDQGRQAMADERYPDATASLDEALALWRGPAIADVSDELCGDIRQSLQDELLTATEFRLDAKLRNGQSHDVATLVPTLLADHPYREHLYEIQMLALAELGRRADALEVYQLARGRLAEDLGVEPGPDLRATEQRILVGDTAVPAALTPRALPRQLPAGGAVLVGRERITTDILDNLRRSTSRPAEQSPGMTLLVGPGGVGKSALAIAAGHQLRDLFPDGTLFANLRGAMGDPATADEVLGRFLRALGLTSRQIPDSGEERRACYLSEMASRRVLVVLDDARDEQQVRPLIPGTPRCGLIITSRWSLPALIDATRWSMPMLSPDDAVELLGRIVGRDRIKAEPTVARRIAELCGHLPLALCIAAARAAVQPAGDLAGFEKLLSVERSRLDALAVGDLDVRATIALTYRALDPDQQRLFRRLGLIATDDWPDWVAQRLLVPSSAEGDDRVSQLLDQLTDVHLVEPIGRDSAGQTRFRMHDLIAEFAAERAVEEEDESHRRRAVLSTLDSWLGLASEADVQVAHGLLTPDVEARDLPAAAAVMARRRPMDWFESERLNLLAAVAQASRMKEGELAATLALRTSGFLAIRAYAGDQERVLRTALDGLPEDGAKLRLYLLDHLFTLSGRQARFLEQPALAAAQLETARLLQDQVWEQSALIRSAWAARSQARFQDAKRFLETASAIHPGDTGEPERLAALKQELGSIYVDIGDAAAAEPLMAQLVDVERAKGPSRALCIALLCHVEPLIDLCRYREGRLALQEMREVAHTLRDEIGVAYADLVLAEISVRCGELEAATALLEDSLPVLDSAARVGSNGDGLRILGELRAAENRPAEAVAYLRRAADVWLSIEKPLEVCRSLGRLEQVLRSIADESAAATVRDEYQVLLDQLDLDHACLRLPPNPVVPVVDPG